MGIEPTPTAWKAVILAVILMVHFVKVQKKFLWVFRIPKKLEDVVYWNPFKRTNLYHVRIQIHDYLCWREYTLWA